MLTNQEITDHIEFLEETLIPDLHDSGNDATAEDFEKCVAIIRQLQDPKCRYRNCQRDAVPNWTTCHRHYSSGRSR